MSEETIQNEHPTDVHKDELVAGTQSTYEPFRVYPHPCPSCGHCPTCGRSRYPSYPPYPYTGPWVFGGDYSSNGVPATAAFPNTMVFGGRFQ